MQTMTLRDKKRFQDTQRRLERKLNGEMPAPYSVRRCCDLLCAKAGIKPVEITIQNNPSPNAVLYTCDNHISLTTYDLKHLSEPDIKALIAHEVGHIKFHHGVGYPSSHCASLISICPVLALVAISVAESIRQNTSAWPWWRLSYGIDIITAALIFVAIVCALRQVRGRLLFRQHQEKMADSYGAVLVGIPTMVHLMQDMVKFEQRERLEIIKTIRELLFTPKAFVKCCWLLFKFQGISFLSKKKWWPHPSYEQRIRNLKRYSGKEVTICKNDVSKRN